MSEDKDRTPVEDKSGSRTFTEDMEVAGSQLADKVQEAIRQGNVRKVVVRNAEGKVLLETSLTVASGAGIVALILNLPWAIVLAVLGALVGAVARVKVEIVREVTDEHPVVEAKKKPAAKKKVNIEEE